MKIYIVFYSTYGHIYQMAEAVAKGAKSFEGAEVSLFRVPELMPEDVLESSGAKEAQKAFSHIPEITPDKLEEADAVIFGTPTRFGMMSAQMRNFFDQTGKQWMNGSYINKIGSVFTSTATQQGGQETTITSFHTTLLHHGFIIVGVPYSEQKLLNMDEITGGSPYGAGTLTDGDGSRQPSENELGIAETQGRHVAETTKSYLS